MKTSNKFKNVNNQCGFIIADFLFALVLVISCGILIFGLTFSLATIEIGQYIVWSTARNYSAANTNPLAAEKQAKLKFANLTAQFPLLTGNGSSGTPWVTIENLLVGDLAKIDSDLSSKLGAEKENKDNAKEFRQPWIGAKADLKLNLLLGFKIPFLGSVVDPSKEDSFTFPIRAFILRHPSQNECTSFYSQRYTEGIQKITGEKFSAADIPDGTAKYVPIEDNGC